MGSVIGGLSGGGGKDPEQQYYSDPYAEELRARLLGSVDKYLQENGVQDYVPEENRPYEWRDPNERARMRIERTQDSRFDRPWLRPTNVQEPGSANISATMPTVNKKTAAKAPTAEEDTAVRDARGDDSRRRYSTAAFAAAMEARQRGDDSAAIKAPKAVLSGTDDEQNEELKRIRKYVARGSSQGGY